MNGAEMAIVFSRAHALLVDLESALIGALDNDIGEGRFTAKQGCVVAELQWPYETYLPRERKNGQVAMRFYVEAKVPVSTEITPSTGTTADADEGTERRGSLGGGMSLREVEHELRRDD